MAGKGCGPDSAAARRRPSGSGQTHREQQRPRPRPCQRRTRDQAPIPLTPDALRDHDQRARRGFSHRQTIQHLRRRQPTEIAYRRLGDSGQHRIGAAKGQDRHLADIDRDPGIDVVPSQPQTQRRHGPQPQDQPSRSAFLAIRISDCATKATTAASRPKKTAPTDPSCPQIQLIQLCAMIARTPSETARRRPQRRPELSQIVGPEPRHPRRYCRQPRHLRCQVGQQGICPRIAKAGIRSPNSGTHVSKRHVAL